MTMIDEETVMFVNESIAEGLRLLREAEEKYRIKYQMRFRLNKEGNVQMHVDPAQGAKG